MAEKWIKDESLKVLLAELRRLSHVLEENIDRLEKILKEREER